MKREEIKRRSQLRKLIKEIKRAMKIIRQNLKASGEEGALVGYNLRNARGLAAELKIAFDVIRDSDHAGIADSLEFLSKVRINIDIELPRSEHVFPK